MRVALDQTLLARLAAIVGDYRAGEIPPIDAARIAHWIGQFPAPTQNPLLTELAHVLQKTYFSKARVIGFARNVVTNGPLTGSDPAAFWKSTKLLDVQADGNSQRDLLALFDAALKDKCSLCLAECGSNAPSRFVYVDDALFSGGRIGADLRHWIETDAPAQGELIVIVIACHAYGKWKTEMALNEAIAQSGKALTLKIRHAITYEDRKLYTDSSDVVRPAVVPADDHCAEYMVTLSWDPVFRSGSQVGARQLFSGNEGRHLLEQEFMRQGVEVRKMCPDFDVYMRPLGRSMMPIMGFGSMVVTYRNCANNTPLVLWAGDPWYPLFPRKTN
ncbi:hypothetical protein [Sphingomonas sp. SUN039]|uniref:phosphoribosyltransferase-like protein n=1 Tax=Sphingomonas sp. SUN039 TaxID=2937787 RepID=UPI002164EB07|nr:hypothetical protein [Sphingomonas sp. SUN039]UVO55130.1 hypothetical protein M0209_13690 [Sphingomonas sp. SUN039]